MSKSKTLNRRQRAVLDGLFAGELTEQKVLKTHGVSRRLYEQWFADERFVQQFEQRVARAHRESRIILARNAPKAAETLAKVTKSQAGETALSLV